MAATTLRVYIENNYNNKLFYVNIINDVYSGEAPSERGLRRMRRRPLPSPPLDGFDVTTTGHGPTAGGERTSRVYTYIIYVHVICVLFLSTKLVIRAHAQISTVREVHRRRLVGKLIFFIHLFILLFFFLFFFLWNIWNPFGVRISPDFLLTTPSACVQCRFTGVTVIMGQW